MQRIGELVKFGVSDTRKSRCESHGEYTEELITLGGKSRWTGCPACLDEQRKEADRQESARFSAELQQRKMGAILNQAAIPQRFQSRTLDAYSATLPEQQKALAIVREYAEQFDDVLANGRSLILCGLPGTGKTHLACGVALSVIDKGKAAAFTSAMNAIRRVRETYRKEATETERQAINSFSKPDLLIVDEVGQQLGTDAEKVTLFDIINARYEAMRPMIVISNLDLNGIREYLGDRAFDRLREGGGRAIQFTWESHRKGG